MLTAYGRRLKAQEAKKKEKSKKKIEPKVTLPFEEEKKNIFEEKEEL